MVSKIYNYAATTLRLVFNAPCLSVARSLTSKLKPSICKILSSVFSSRNVSHKPRMSNLHDEFKSSLISSNFGFMWQILILATCKPLCSKCRRVVFSVLSCSNSGSYFLWMKRAIPFGCFMSYIHWVYRGVPRLIASYLFLVFYC